MLSEKVYRRESMTVWKPKKARKEKENLKKLSQMKVIKNQKRTSTNHPISKIRNQMHKQINLI